MDNKNLDFPRGYHIEVWGGMGMPAYGFGMQTHEMNKYIGGQVGGYGDKLRKDVKKFYGVGKVTADKMYQLGIFTGFDLKQKTLEYLDLPLIRSLVISSLLFPKVSAAE